MNYSEFTHEQNERFSSFLSENEGSNLNRHDIYHDVVENFYAKYDLPALWLDESGFSTGEADNEDFDFILQRIKDIHFDDFTSNLPKMERKEVSNDDILIYLDNRLMIDEEEAYDEAFEKELASLDEDEL